MDFSEKNAGKWRTDTVAAAVTVPIWFLVQKIRKIKVKNKRNNNK
jgi:hypothetical protein